MDDPRSIVARLNATAVDCTPDMIVARLTSPPVYASTAEPALAWGLGNVRPETIRPALNKAIERGLVQVVRVQDTTYGRGVRFVRATAV